MPIDIRINTSDADRELRDINAAVEDLRPVWQQLAGGYLRTRIRAIFRTGGYGEWPPRKDSSPHPLLIRTGRLFRSLTSETSDSVIELTPDRLTLGTSVPYAQYHITGTRDIPQRNFLELLIRRASFTQDLESEVDNWLIGIINRR